jgi:hypothetical protein
MSPCPCSVSGSLTPQEQGKALFLYGHEVLPDDRFFEGKVAEVGSDYLIAEGEISLLDRTALCLVPDKNTLKRGGTLRVGEVQGRKVTIPGSDLPRRVKVGSTFILGPCYGTPLSYFREMLAFCSGRLTFLTTEAFLNLKGKPPDPGRRSIPDRSGEGWGTKTGRGIPDRIRRNDKSAIPGAGNARSDPSAAEA